MSNSSERCPYTIELTWEEFEKLQTCIGYTGNKEVHVCMDLTKEGAMNIGFQLMRNAVGFYNLNQLRTIVLDMVDEACEYERSRQ